MSSVAASSAAASDPEEALASLTIGQISKDLTAPYFLKDIYASEQDVIDHINLTQTVFVPGFLDHLVTGFAPSASFFMDNSLSVQDGWGIYVITLATDNAEHNIDSAPDLEFRLYLGSGTETAIGVPLRFGNYENGIKLPAGVNNAIKDGLEIVAKSLVVWCPLPSAANIPRARMLFLLLEGTLSHSFGFHAPNQVVAAKMSLWARDDLDYTGLCRHSSLMEISTLQRELGLTDQQIEAEYAKRLLRRKSPEFKALRNEASRMRYAANRVHLLKYARQWNYDHREEVNERSRKYREAGLTKISQRKYRATEKGKQHEREYNARPEIKARSLEVKKEYRDDPDNKAKHKEYMKEYVTRPGVKERQKETRKRYEARKKAAKEALKMKSQSILNIGANGSTPGK